MCKSSGTPMKRDQFNFVGKKNKTDKKLWAFLAFLCTRPTWALTQLRVPKDQLDHKLMLFYCSDRSKSKSSKSFHWEIWFLIWNGLWGFFLSFLISILLFLLNLCFPPSTPTLTVGCASLFFRANTNFYPRRMQKDKVDIIVVSFIQTTSLWKLTGSLQESSCQNLALSRSNYDKNRTEGRIYCMCEGEKAIYRRKRFRPQ